MRPIQLEDERELLELHEMEVLEEDLNTAVIEVAVMLLDPSNDPVEREIYRADLRDLRRMHLRVQRQNGTQLVLDSRTYDAEAGDEYVDVTEVDACRLAWDGITLPDSIWVAAVLAESDFEY